MAGMLSKAAHVFNLLALVAGSFTGYVAWVFTHPQLYPAGPASFVSIRNGVISLAIFIALFLLSVLLGLVALFRGNSRPAAVQSN